MVLHYFANSPAKSLTDCWVVRTIPLTPKICLDARSHCHSNASSSWANSIDQASFEHHASRASAASFQRVSCQKGHFVSQLCAIQAGDNQISNPRDAEKKFQGAFTSAGGHNQSLLAFQQFPQNNIHTQVAELARIEVVVIMHYMIGD